MTFRSAIEDELEVLYDAYYEELEIYANQQQRYVAAPGSVPAPLGPGPFPGSVEFDSTGAVIPNELTKHPAPPIIPDDYEDDDEEYEDEGSEEEEEEDDEDDGEEHIPAAYPKNPRRTPTVRTKEVAGAKRNDGPPQDFFTFGPGLTVAGEASFPFSHIPYHAFPSFHPGETADSPSRLRVPDEL